MVRIAIGKTPVWLAAAAWPPPVVSGRSFGSALCSKCGEFMAAFPVDPDQFRRFCPYVQLCSGCEARFAR
jgi:hypothetical protein